MPPDARPLPAISDDGASAEGTIALSGDWTLRLLTPVLAHIRGRLTAVSGDAALAVADHEADRHAVGLGLQRGEQDPEEGEDRPGQQDEGADRCRDDRSAPVVMAVTAETP